MVTPKRSNFFIKNGTLKKFSTENVTVKISE